jgi:AraC-like DNA-binding protein
MRHMDPALRRWWRLLEELPLRLGQVERWLDPEPPPANGHGGDHLHAVPTLVACLAGVVRCQRPGGSIDLAPGEVLLIAPGTWHTHLPSRPGSVFFAQGFLATAADVVLGDHHGRFGGRLPREPSRRLIGLALAADDPGKRRARCAELIGQVLAETVADLGFDDPVLRRMLHRMWSSLHRGIGVGDLVAASGLSRAQAYRVFTSGYGVPPKAALELARLELAEGLRAGGLGVATTAARCGFPSAGTYTRARRRVAAR